jgi:hypothetical protein
MAALAGGLISLLLGIILIIAWWGYFIKALMAGIPVILILGGALAAYLGYEEMKDKKAAAEMDKSGDGLKNEVENLREQVKELKEEKTEQNEDTKND